MNWTLAQLRAKVRELTGQCSTSQLSDADLTDKINDFYCNVFPDEIELPELKGFYSFSTVQGDGEYALPSTVLRIKKPITIDDGNGDAVARLGFWNDENAFFTEYPDDASASQNAPLDLLQYGSKLYLRPIPDGVYTVKAAAVQRPAALVEGTDTVINPKWGPAIAYGTAIQMFIDQKDSDGADELTGIYQVHLNSIGRKHLQQLSALRSVPSF